MAFTDINSEDRLVQKTFADHLEKALGWESVYAWNAEVFGTPHPTPADGERVSAGRVRGRFGLCRRS